MKAIGILILGFVLTMSGVFADDGKTRILFVGNSYTSQIRKTVTELIKASPEGKTVEMEFVAPGGKTLEFHTQSGSAVEKIKEGNWDFVVLQDQSQTPAVFPKKFESAAVELDKLIDEVGAQTVFYQTWGRRDGDKQNAHLFPDYDSMQKELSASYAKAAKRCDATLAPVGDTWAKVRKADPKLGKELYSKDGSHPSSKGAYLAASVFYATIFGKSSATVNFKGGLSDAEVKVIQGAIHVEGLPAKDGYPVNRTITNKSGVKIEAQISGRSKTKLFFTSKGRSHQYGIDQLSDEDAAFVDSLPVTR